MSRASCARAARALTEATLLASLASLASLAALSPTSVQAQTVGESTTPHGCDTSAIQGWRLTDQLGEAQACMDPSGLVPIVPSGSLTLADRRPYFATPQARGALYAARDRGVAVQVNYAFRNLLEQHWLHIARSPACGAVAEPGSSNHESGSAFDIQQYSTARAVLEANGCNWPNIPADPWHFDCAAAPRRTVLHFQRLWNLNNPGDTIDADNIWGPQTRNRLEESPINGFPLSGCEPAPVPDAGPPAMPDAGRALDAGRATDAGGATDAGSALELDAAVGSTDASPFDATAIPEGGRGEEGEAGVTSAPLRADCGCRVEAHSASRAPWALLSLAGLALVRRRRRASARA